MGFLDKLLGRGKKIAEEAAEKSKEVAGEAFEKGKEVTAKGLEMASEATDKAAEKLRGEEQAAETEGASASAGEEAPSEPPPREGQS